MDTQQDNVLSYREIMTVLRSLRFPENPHEERIWNEVRFGTANDADEIRGTDDYD